MFYKIIIAFIFSFFILFFNTGVLVFAQDQISEQNGAKLAQLPLLSQEIGDNDKTMSYAFLAEDRSLGDGPLLSLFLSNKEFSSALGHNKSLVNKFRPFVQWRAWANKKQYLLSSFLFFLVTVSSVSFIFPNKLKTACSQLKESFWKCFGKGLLISLFLLVFARAAFFTEIGWPLGIFVVALFQLGLVFGLAIVARSIGHTLILLCHVNQIFKGIPEKYLVLEKILEIFVGSLILSLFIIIPSPFALPPAGTRILTLLSLLGFGALYRSCFDQE